MRAIMTSKPAITVADAFGHLVENAVFAVFTQFVGGVLRIFPIYCQSLFLGLLAQVGQNVGIVEGGIERVIGFDEIFGQIIGLRNTA